MSLAAILRSPASCLPASSDEWDQLIPEASAASLLPALHSRLIAAGFAHRVPPAVRQLLDATQSLNGERNRKMLAEAVHTATLLNQIGITPLALKGLAYLLSGVYPDPAVRYLADLDFLVPVANLPMASCHLLENGFFENETAILLEIRHHYPALRRPNGPHIELHHAVGIGVCNRLLRANDIIADAIPITVYGANFLIPSPTHLAIHLILHSQLAHPYHDRVFPPLRALHDLAQLQTHYASSIDWLRIDEIFRRAGHSATLHLHLAQAHAIIGLAPPFSLQLGPIGKMRLRRRRILYNHPILRLFDPSYLSFSLLSRRLRLLPGLINTPRLWPVVLKRILQLDFYRKPLAV